jgi:hypothetical protein
MCLQCVLGIALCVDSCTLDYQNLRSLPTAQHLQVYKQSRKRADDDDLLSGGSVRGARY